jgi:N-acetylglucosamine-6-phosphate deacetylase
MNHFFDIQVNGYGGIDFNTDDLTAENLHLACEAIRRDGVQAMLATIITEELGAMRHRVQRLVELRNQDELAREVIAGIHVEGPFINETTGYRGAHPSDAIRPANIDEAKSLLDAGDGLVKLVTLAPERDENACTTRFLTDQGVRVSAGHCDASLDDLNRAIDNGLTLYTHLGNGCPMQMHRHDNIIQRALSLSDRLILCFIADGVHVPFFALKNYIRAAGIERCLVTSDAVAPAGLGPGRYSFARWTVDVGPDLAVRAPDGSHLVGSAISMKQSSLNLQTELGFTNEQVEMLCVNTPRRAIGL